MAKTQVTLPESDYKKSLSKKTQYTVISKTPIKDKRFGNFIHWRDTKTRENIMIKEKIFSSKKTAAKEILKLKSRLANQHPNTLQLIDWTCLKKKSLCSTSYIVSAYYKQPDTDAS